VRLSDISVTRPVFAAVLSLLLVAFGLVAYERLPLRQYPDIDPPVVSIETQYRGASATVVESRVTELIEERIAGLEGMRFVESVSENGRSKISIEFQVGRNPDAAANDVRDRVSTILDELPVEADPPEIQKVDSNEDVILWLNLTSDRLSVPELTDYAERYLADRLSVIDGVARVRIGGGQTFAMRIWLDRRALAARQLTVGDVERALRSENVELPAGSLESKTRQLTVRLDRNFRTAQDFARLVVKRTDDYLVRLGDVATVVKGSVEDRTSFRGNGQSMIGLGIIKQATANTIAVARAAKVVANRINRELPAGLAIKESYDTSVFVEAAISEVYNTLFIACGLVVLVILVFLGSLRAMIVPAVTVPVSIIATFIVLFALGFTVNLLTLLALVLAIGLVVDDSIVVIENIYRRIERYGETPLVAAFRGTRQVGFAVIATTLVLIAVFAPIAFLQGDIGRLFGEFALTMSAAVAFSALVALSLSPMMASKLLTERQERGAINRMTDAVFTRLSHGYGRALKAALARPSLPMLALALVLGASNWIFGRTSAEYAPREDSGAFFVIVQGPEGATYSYMTKYMDEIERRLMPLVEKGEATRLLVRAPRTFGSQIQSFNSGIVIVVLDTWAKRRPVWKIMEETGAKLADLPGVLAFPVIRQSFGRSIQKPVQLVLGGGTYEELARWRDVLNKKIAERNPGLEGMDWDYKETKPQIDVKIDYDRAAALGVTVTDIGRTLETMLGSRRVTTYIDDGEEYDVILEGERREQRTPTDLENLYVRSATSGQLVPLSNVVRLAERGDSAALNRYNRVRAITLEANLKPGFALGDALAYLEHLVRENLPETAIIDYKGQSRDFKQSGSSIGFVFVLGIVVVFLVLAAQFESWVHPFVIMLTVPLAVAGGLLGLFVTGGTLNIYSEIGLVMLVGLATKNGILIVEFANQLRDEGRAFDEAIYEASLIRFRPILMTSITTAMGAVPLMLAFGAGAETRSVIGVVVFAGVIVATLLTLFVVPAAYSLLARRTGSPGAVARRLEAELQPAAGE